MELQGNGHKRDNNTWSVTSAVPQGVLELIFCAGNPRLFPTLKVDPRNGLQTLKGVTDRLPTLAKACVFVALTASGASCKGDGHFFDCTDIAQLGTTDSGNGVLAHIHVPVIAWERRALQLRGLPLHCCRHSIISPCMSSLGGGPQLKQPAFEAAVGQKELNCGAT